jgi:hypothetical protein
MVILINIRTEEQAGFRKCSQQRIGSPTFHAILSITYMKGNRFSLATSRHIVLLSMENYFICVWKDVPLSKLQQNSIFRYMYKWTDEYLSKMKACVIFKFW